MKYLVKNKIPDQTPYVSLNYNGDVNYAQISGSGLPSTIHAEEDGLYIEKNNKIWPMTHPDLSTQPSILPQRFGKLPIYEELIANTSYSIGSDARIVDVSPDVPSPFVSFVNGDRMYYTDTSNFVIFDNTSGKLYNQDYNDSHDYYVFFVDNVDNSISYYGVKLNASSGNIDRIKSNTTYAQDLTNGYGLNIQDQIGLPTIILNNNNRINRKNIIQASAFNETNYSPITIENGNITTTLNFIPDYFLVQYFGEMDDYYYYVNNIQSLHIFNWSTYKWCKGSDNTMTKYCTNSSYGYEDFTDNKTELDLEDDAAYVNWGPAWRIPSKEQFDELINSSYTTTEWTTQNGVNGRKITSNTNGNSIFLPAAGDRYESSLYFAGSEGHYWSRTLYSDRPSRAWNPYFFSSIVSTSNQFRCYGQSVRPICINSSQADRDYIDLGLPSGTLWATMNIGASSPEDYGLYFAWGETEGYQ